MDNQWSAPIGETASDGDIYEQTANNETTHEETDNDNTNNFQFLLGETDPNDPRYNASIPQLCIDESSSGESLLQSNLGGNAHSYTYDGNISYPADDPAYHSSFPGFSNSSSWQNYGLNSNSAHFVYSDQLDYTPAGSSLSPGHASYNSNGDASVAWDIALPLNYSRQSEDPNQWLDPYNPSITSGPSAPSIRSAQSAQSAQSIPFSPPTTNLTSYYPGTPQRSRAATEYSCKSCDARFPTRKDRDRHVPIHDEESAKYQCRCTYRNHRKDNYKRHHTTCKPNSYKQNTFICKCSFENSDQADHLDHIEACEHFKKRRGRPPRSSATSLIED